MKTIRGFNLVELMVALAMSAVLIDVVSQSYANSIRNFLFSSKQLQLSRDLRFSLSLIKHDLQNAGVFGSYSLHDACAGSSCSYISYSLIKYTNSGCATTEWCTLDNTTLGVRSDSSSLANFPQLATTLANEGVTLMSNSEVLRVQYSGSGVAYFNPIDANVSCMSNQNCGFNLCTASGNANLNKLFLNQAQFSNNGVVASSGVYFLASSNHGYLLSLPASPTTTEAEVTGFSGSTLTLNFKNSLNLGCPANSSLAVLAESYVATGSGSSNIPNYVAYDPDSYSLQLVNFYTRYYFVGTKNGITGLYAKTLASSGSLSSADLISDQVTKLAFNYKVNTTTPVNNYPSTASSYQLLTTSAVQTGNLWNKIAAVTISLSGQSGSLAGVGISSLSQVESDSVGWL